MEGERYSIDELDDTDEDATNATARDRQYGYRVTLGLHT